MLPTESDIAAALAGVGIGDRPLKTLERDGRAAVFLPGDRIAWFPRNEDGRAAMTRERRVLRLIETYCSFMAPRVLHEHVDGWEVRSKGWLPAMPNWPRAEDLPNLPSLCVARPPS